MIIGKNRRGGNKKAKTSASGGGGVALSPPCEPSDYEVKTAATGMVVGEYLNIPITGGSGTTLHLSITVEGDPAYTPPWNIKLGDDPGMIGDEISKYIPGDIITVPAGKLGAGSSEHVLKVIGRVCHGSGGGGPVAGGFCQPRTYEIVTQPTGATDATYYDVPTTGGSGTGLKLQLHVLNGVVEPNGILSSAADPAQLTLYDVDDVITIAPGQLGAGSTGMTLKITARTCGIDNNCVPDRFTVVTPPTGAVDAMYSNVPTTGGTGQNLLLGTVTIVSGAIDLSQTFGFGGVDYSGAYVVGDVVTVAPGQVGAGSSGFTLRIESIDCTPSA